MFLICISVRRWLTILTGIAILAFVHPMVFAVPANTNWTPPASLIAEMEERLAMPMHASPLKSYLRYYSGITVKNRRMIVGIFLLDVDHAGIKITDVDNLPRVFDGGCEVINVKYDVRKKRVVEIFCNGVA